MTKLTLSLITCFISASSLHSQTTSIAIMPFMYSMPDYKARSSQLQEMVIEILSKKTDIALIDRSKDTMLLVELDKQIRETSIASPNLVQQGKVLGAQNMIVGTLSNITVTKQSSSSLLSSAPSATVYSANITFSLQLLDVETGRIVKQKAFNENDKGLFGIKMGSTSTSSEIAIDEAMSKKKKQVLAWINDCYPPLITIIKIEEKDKNGYPQTILVTGVDASLEKGTKLLLNEIETIDLGNGKKIKRSKNFATLKITEIQDEVTICKVTDGEKEVEGKMTSGAKLEVAIK